MAQNILPSPENFNNSQSSESNLDSRLIEAQTNIEQIKERIYTAMDELAGWLVTLQKLQGEADPFKAFINNELEIEL